MARGKGRWAETALEAHLLSRGRERHDWHPFGCSWRSPGEGGWDSQGCSLSQGGFLSFLFIYLLERCEDQKSSIHWFTTWDWARLNPGLPVGVRGAWAIICCPPGCTGRELAQKWSKQGLKWHSNMGCQYCNNSLSSIPYHSVDSSPVYSASHSAPC